MNKTICLIISFLCSVGSLSQTKPEFKLNLFVTNVEQFAKSFPQEKVYLHLDNTGYFMGERIWFKAYVVRDDKQRLSDMSRVLYVELVDPSGEVVKSEKLKIVNGGADGYFDLKQLAVSGFYEIRAYTSYMLNWGNETMYSRVLPVLEAPEKEGDYDDRRMDEFSALTRLPDYREQADEGKKKMNVAFYPEGGHLVAGLDNYVAFSITDENGLHFETKGYLESGGRKVCDVSTIREGRGVFTCKPTGEKLTLHLQNKDGRERTFRLPDTEEEGCALHIDALSADHLDVTISATSAFNGQRLGVVAMNHGKVVRFNELTIGKTDRITFSKELLGKGISQISVVTQDGSVIATRMVFVNPKYANKSIEVTVDNDYLKPYGKITMTAKSIPNSHFSMAVRNYHTQVDGWQADLASWLLLSSDLKGYIENARYYVEADDQEHRQAADLLMMVQGWQRYDLPRMASSQSFILSHPLERSLHFEGSIKKRRKTDKYGVDGVSLWAVYMTDNSIATDSIVYEDMYLTDKDGYFHFKAPDFYGERDVVMRPEKDGALRQYKFMFNRGYTPITRHIFKNELLQIPIDTPRVWNDWRDPDTILSMTQREFMLSQVVVKGRYMSDAAKYWKAQQRALSKSSIYYDCAKEYEKLRDKGDKYVDFLKWLEKRNPYFSGGWPSEPEDLKKLSASSSHRTVYPKDGIAYKRRPVVWILNNVFNSITYAPAKMSDNSIVSAFSNRASIPDELRYVKSVYISEEPDAWKPFLTAPDLESSHPVTIFVFRGAGQNNWESLRKGIRSITLQGYQKPRTFKAPNYRVLPAVPDFRRTLYWNPNVKVDEKGEARITFYNNRDCRQLSISAEGFASDGTPLIY